MYKRRYRKRYYRKKPKGKKLATVGTVRRMINTNAEHKWKNGNVVSTNVGYQTVSFVTVNNMDKGTARNQRMGNKTVAKSLEVGFVCVAQTVASTVRCLVFIDKQPNSAVISPNLLFADGTAGTTNVISPFNPDIKPSRIQVLYDKLVTVGIQGGSTNINDEKRWRIKLSLRSKPIQYNDGNAGTITDIVKNAIYIWILSDEDGTVVPAITPQITYDWVYRYEDS